MENENKALLTGTWELQSFRTIGKDGQGQDWGEQMHGYLIYTADGHVAAAINCRSAAALPSLKSNDMLHYAGTFEWQGTSTLLHDIHNASRLDLIGKSAARRIERLDEKELVLSGDFDGPVELRWTRAANAQHRS